MDDDENVRLVFDPRDCGPYIMAPSELPTADNVYAHGGGNAVLYVRVERLEDDVKWWQLPIRFGIAIRVIKRQLMLVLYPQLGVEL